MRHEAGSIGHESKRLRETRITAVEGGTTKGDVIRFFGRTNLTGSQEGSFSETMEPMPKSSCYSPGGNDVTRISAPPHRTATCFHRDRIADLQLLPPGLVQMNPALNSFHVGFGKRISGDAHIE